MIDLKLITNFANKISHYGLNTSYFRIIERHVSCCIGWIGWGKKEDRIWLDVLFVGSVHAVYRFDYMFAVG